MSLFKNKRLLIAVILLALVLMLLTGDESVAEGKLKSLPMEATEGRPPKAECYLPDNAGYEDESLRIEIENMRVHDTNVMVARVRIAHASQIRTAMAARYGSTGTVMPDKLAQRANAVLAINGDFFNYNSTGYLVRQGKLYREKPHETFDMLIIDDLGDFHIIVDPSKQKVAEFSGTIVNSFNFGPALVVDGEIVKTTKRVNVGLEKETQRMGIGQIGPLEYICVATEGPENKGSDGLTIPEFAQLMKDLGAVQAYNLDGGSSSAMVLDGRKINALSSRKLRPICDILYFATLVE